MAEQAGTTGQHAHHGHADWSVRGQQLVSEGEATAPMVDQALGWLAERVPGARDVLDVGSGPGVAACAFARMLPRARVLAVDGAESLLAMAGERAARLGIGDRLTTRRCRCRRDWPNFPRRTLSGSAGGSSPAGAGGRIARARRPDPAGRPAGVA